MDPVPDLRDVDFLSYLADDNFSKAMIYDPALFNGADETLAALQDIVPGEALISREMLNSQEALVNSFQNLAGSDVDHIILILSALDIGHIISSVAPPSPDTPLVNIVSTVLPITELVPGGFPFRYDLIISGALQELTAMATVDEEERSGDNTEGNITISIPFSSPDSRRNRQSE